VGKATALVLLAVLTLHTLEPEATKLGLHLLFPSILIFVIFSCGGGIIDAGLLVGVLSVAAGGIEIVNSIAIELKVAIIVRVIVAASVRGANGAAGHGSAHVTVRCRLLNLAKRKHHLRLFHQ
jgi:hypothetical protein